MDRVESFYDQTGKWWGGQPVMESDRQRAATIERLCGAGSKHVLELGAGFGRTAAAMADRGHSVVAVELSSVRAGHARRFAQEPRRGSLTIIEGDFYDVDLVDSFEVVCYWNGFGIGSDADQRRLLRRIASDWLTPGGCLLMNVFSAWWWVRKAGTEQFKPPFFMQGFDFDPVLSRFIDSWWLLNRESSAVSEQIRCYSPVDLLLLLEGTGLRLEVAEVGEEAIDLTANHYTMRSPLWDTWKYLVKLVPDSP